MLKSKVDSQKQSARSYNKLPIRRTPSLTRADSSQKSSHSKPPSSQPLKVKKLKPNTKHLLNHTRKSTSSRKLTIKRQSSSENTLQSVHQRPDSSNHRRSAKVLGTTRSKVKPTLQRVSSLQSLKRSEDSLSKQISRYFAKHHTPPPTTVDFYTLGKVIGKGTFGKVLLGVHKLTGMQVAIKAIDRAVLKDAQSREKIDQEVALMRQVTHRRVVQLLEVVEAPKHVLLVMEYMGGGDLFQYIKMKGRLSEAEARPVFKQILEGVLAIHSSNVAHRDLKLDNILMNTQRSSMKICDFGVSRRVKPGQVIKEQCGTPAYLAPEIVADRGYDGFAVDLWSLGVVLYIMICGNIPFKATTLTELHKAILQGVYSVPDYISAEAKSLIGGLLQLVPTNRISVTEALCHPWFIEPATESSFVCKPVEIDDFLLAKVERFGYPRQFIVNSVKSSQMNHANASYYLLHNAIC